MNGSTTYLPWAVLPRSVEQLLAPLAESTSLSILVVLLCLHAVISLFVALACLRGMPEHLRRPRGPVLLLLFNFAFIAPVVGPVCVLWITRRSLRQAQEQARQARPTSIALPAYDVHVPDAVRSSQVAIRSRLASEVPGNIRMQALLTLQAVPGRVANPILEDLLGDSTDDVRLLAFGMLDSEEKRISQAIQRERAQLDHELSREQRYDCLHHLAELHWELVYACLAQGELRRHILRQTRDYLEAALATGVEPSPGLCMLQGRVLLAQGEFDAAEAVFRQALLLGLPATSVLPYLAEIAFVHHRYDEVRRHLEGLVDLHTAARTTAVVNLWTGRETVSRFSDRHLLPHL